MSSTSVLLPKPEGRVMSHDDNVEHTELVTDTQAMVSNDIADHKG